ncbi:MAG: hypothetical protein F7C32_03180 [Desulfurococcales archaeon]|nr:hypothetical protein [Desulfurococcales archaeon]
MSSVWNPLPTINLVYEEVKNMKEPMPAKELYTRITRRSSISLCSFYKSLMILEMKGYISAEPFGSDDLLIKPSKK